MYLKKCPRHDSVHIQNVFFSLLSDMYARDCKCMFVCVLGCVFVSMCTCVTHLHMNQHFFACIEPSVHV